MEHGYHGDTIGTMSAGERGVFNAAYEPLLFAVDRVPFPEAGREQETLDAFEAFCASGQVAALLVEPLVLGAGGMKIYPAFVLAELKRIAERHERLERDLARFAPAPYVAPSSGLVVIADVLSSVASAGDEIVLAGFGHSGWEWHPFAAERRYVDALAAQGRLRRLNPLPSPDFSQGA